MKISKKSCDHRKGKKAELYKEKVNLDERKKSSILKSVKPIIIRLRKKKNEFDNVRRFGEMHIKDCAIQDLINDIERFRRLFKEDSQKI